MPPRSLAAPRRHRHARRRFRARVEPLEPRLALTVTTTLDPSFGSRGVVLGATSPTDTNLSTATAVAVQPDGKIVEVGAIGQQSATAYPGLAARRYNADGSVDNAFGTNGQVIIPYAPTSGGFSATPRNVVVEANGDVVFAAVAAYPVVGMSGVSTFYSVMVRLTPAGQFDPTFGTDGEFAVPQVDGDLTSVAMQADEKIVAGGYIEVSGTGPSLSVIRLTTAGALDTTFNSTGQASVNYLYGPGMTVSDPNAAGVAVTPGGQILVGGDVSTRFTGGFSYAATLAELQADGTPNPSFGTGGETSPAALSGTLLGAFAVRPDGSIVVAGGLNSTALARLIADGAVDPTFTPVTAPSSTVDSVDSIALGADGSIMLGGTTPSVITTAPFVARYLSTGAVDTSFANAGRAELNITPTFTASSTATMLLTSVNNLALTAGGDILAVGEIASYAKTPSGDPGANIGNQAFLAQLLPVKTSAVTNDYDGDGKADIAAVLGAFALYGYRPSSGAPDVLAPFGPATVGAAIPAPGDYDGDGKTDPAVYLPSLGILAYRPSSGGQDVIIPFGSAGAGNSIPDSGAGGLRRRWQDRPGGLSPRLWHSRLPAVLGRG